MRFGQEDRLKETGAESTDEREVTGRLAEVRTGRGSSKERVTEERVNMKAKEEELEGKEHSRSRTW